MAPKFEHYAVCVYQIVKCSRPSWKCREDGKCPAGRAIYRNTYTGGFHHHWTERDIEK